MIVEFTGPTGVGKSSCLAQTLRALESAGVNAGIVGHVANSVQGIPRAFTSLDGHNWKTDLAALPWAIMLLLANPRYAWFVMRAILVSGTHRIPVARAVIRKLGIYRYLSRPRFRDTVFLVDEGILHVSHNILVPSSGVGSTHAYDEFASLTPLPTIAIVLDAPHAILVQRLKCRGDLSPRICSESDLDGFLRDAARLFSVVAPVLLKRIPGMHIDTTKTENDEVGRVVSKMICRMLPSVGGTSVRMPSDDLPIGPRNPQSTDSR